MGAIIPFIPEKARVLDVGCGDSEMLEKIKKGKKCRFLVGIDIHKKLVKKKGIYALRGDAEFLPFRDSSFGCLISTATIEHLPEPEKAISEFKRVLKPEGVLIITTPNPLYSKIADIAAKLKLKYREGLETPIKLNELKRTLLKHDLSIIYAQYFLAFPVKIFFEEPLEKILQKSSIGRKILLNQIVVAKKVG